MPEINLDGIVGPTHHFGGLAFGNVASMEHASEASNPKAAALQGLEKMKLLHDLGLVQGVLPPHPRPYLPTLRSLGFTGSDREVIEKVFKQDPELFYRCSSSAFMWTANAATTTPACDAKDKQTQFTVANLQSHLHRSLEAEVTADYLTKIFPSPSFVHHSPATYDDEGAANHTRFCRDETSFGVYLFVYGKEEGTSEATQKYPARQDLKAQKQIVQAHGIPEERVIYAQQNPKAIDAGVFHNDVISVGHRNFFLYHEEAFVNTKEVIDVLERQLEVISATPLIPVCVPTHRICLEKAVSTYLFNSQIVTLPKGAMAMIAPQECAEDPATHAFLQEMVSKPDIPIQQIHYVDLHESMRNGGGPACLRLRVVLTDEELAKIHPGILLNEQLYQRLKAWIHTHYRDQLLPSDLADPGLYEESKQALSSLNELLFGG